MSSALTLGIDCGYRTGGVALVGDDWQEVHDLPVYSEGGVDVVALMDILTSATTGDAKAGRQLYV